MSTPPRADPVEPSADVERQLELANSQLALYARDLKHVLEREREKSRELDAAHQQLQAYARDLKKALQAEKQKASDLEQAYLDTVMRLTRASQFKDEETGAHIIRLSHYSKSVAVELELDPEQTQLIFDAAPMHDVGKIGIPDAILLKPGPLDDEEWKIMRSHPAIGASLLKGSTSPLIEVARNIALNHHERWDGSGYPAGLRGEDIPLPGRIVMLADIYDALRSRRSYKPPFEHDRAYDIIVNGDPRSEPSHFDPDLLQVFRDSHREFHRIFHRYAD